MNEGDAVMGNLERLRALGVSLAIDDFGTGYSSLSYLQRFPIDIIELDKSFVACVADGAEASAVARAVTDLGRTWNLRIVAEGIETAEQLSALEAMGCHLGQGYYLGKPMPPEAMSDFLSNTKRGRPKAASLEKNPGGDLLSQPVSR